MEQSYADQFLLGLVEFLEWSKWLFLLGFCLTLGDVKFGIAASRYRQEEVKVSRAIRRTLDKICGYIIWVMMAYTFGQAFGKSFGVDLIPLLILLIIYGVELESIFVNYFAARGKNVKVNILAFFGKKTDILDINDTDDREKE